MGKKSRFLLCSLLAVVLILLPIRTVGGQDDTPQPQTSTPGVELARSITATTGVAISPLLGVGGIGALRYFSTPEGERGELPWYARPHFWVPALLIVLLLGSKEIFLAAFPPGKKPLDALEVFESKLSAIVAVPVVIPMIAETLNQVAIVFEPGTAYAGLMQSGAQQTNPFFAALGIAGYVVGIALSIIGFLAVWLAGHSINLLILLSPFSLIDIFLKGIRYTTLAIIVGAAFIHPLLGAAVALVILWIAIRMSGWAFRLTVFGTVFASDLLAQRHRKETPEGEAITGFMSRNLAGVPKRTYGKILRTAESGIVFHYRRWLVLARKSLELPSASYSIGRGLLSPHLTREGAKGQLVSVITFPPRYRTHEEVLCRYCTASKIQDLGLTRGWKSGISWLREMLDKTEAGIRNRGVEGRA